MLNIARGWSAVGNIEQSILLLTMLVNGKQEWLSPLCYAIKTPTQYIGNGRKATLAHQSIADSLVRSLAFPLKNGCRVLGAQHGPLLMPPPLFSIFQFLEITLHPMNFSNQSDWEVMQQSRYCPTHGVGSQSTASGKLTDQISGYTRILVPQSTTAP